MAWPNGFDSFISGLLGDNRNGKREVAKIQMKIMYFPEERLCDFGQYQSNREQALSMVEIVNTDKGYRIE